MWVWGRINRNAYFKRGLLTEVIRSEKNCGVIFGVCKTHFFEAIIQDREWKASDNHMNSFWKDAFYGIARSSTNYIHFRFRKLSHERKSPTKPQFIGDKLTHTNVGRNGSSVKKRLHASILT